MKASRWPSVPIRRLGSIVGGGTPTADSTNWDGGIPFATPPDLRPVVGRVVRSTQRTLSAEGVSAGSTMVPSGSVLLSIRAPIGYVATTGGAMAFNQGCRAIVPFEHVSARYLTYALVAAADELEAVGRGTTFTELSAAQMAALELPAPPLEEQRAIADYLDRETARIDTLIEEQQRLIEMLRQRRRAVIEHATATGGASPPLEWRVATLRRVGRFITGSTPKGNEEELFDLEGKVGWARPEDLGEHVTPGRRLSEEGVGQVRSSKDAVLVCCIGATVGKVGWAEGSIASNQQITAIEVDGCVKYWYYALTGSRAALVALAVGNTIPILNNTRLGELVVAIPSVDEQRRIAAYLDVQTAKVDDLIAETERFIELSRERRSALITAAVTGQIDVQAVA